MSQYSESDTEVEMSSEDSSPDQTHLSSSLMLYTLLPSMLQRRLSKLRSLKGALPQRSYLARRDRASSHASSESITPPPSYRSDVDPFELSMDIAPLYRAGRTASTPSRPSSSDNIAPAHAEETRSGVQWKYVDAGLALLSLSQSEAKVGPRTPNLIRRQYIDGIACILRGLPTKLSREEELSLLEALPSNLKPAEPTGLDYTSSTSSRRQDCNLARSTRQCSTLHQSVAAATLYIFLAASFLLPYIQLLVRQAYRFNRKHRISDRMIAQGLLTADVVSKHTIVIASQVCAVNNGKIGESLRDIGLYMIQGFGGGIYDGLGEGMQVIGWRGGAELRRSDTGWHEDTVEVQR